MPNQMQLDHVLDGSLFPIDAISKHQISLLSLLEALFHISHQMLFLHIHGLVEFTWH